MRPEAEEIVGVVAIQTVHAVTDSAAGVPMPMSALLASIAATAFTLGARLGISAAQHDLERAIVLRSVLLVTPPPPEEAESFAATEAALVRQLLDVAVPSDG